MISYEQAKQQVAEKHKFKDWNRLIIFGQHMPDNMYAEAAELYARNLANEKVKEDRMEILHALELTYDITDDGVGLVNDLPLPFPDEK